MRLDSRRLGLLKTLETVFEPLARLLVEHGVSSPQAERLLRAVCVREVVKSSATPGKRPNASRVALVTGVDRREVTRILKTRRKLGEVNDHRHRLNRVLAGWHSDAAFSSGGRPRVLLIKPSDRQRGSFWALAKRCAPGVYPGLILSELLRVGAVEELEGGRLRVSTRQYRAAEYNEESVSEIRARVRDLIQTMLNNATEAGWPRICRTVERTDIDPKFLPLIRKMFADRSEATLSGVQEELRSVRWKRTGRSRQGVRVGLTVFTYEESSREDTSNEKRTEASPERSHESRQRTKRKHTK